MPDLSKDALRTEAASSTSLPLPGRLADVVAAAEHEAKLKAAQFRWDPITGRTTAPSSDQPRNPRRLNVLMTKGGKSLFYSLMDERVRLFWPGETVTEAPDIVVTTEPEKLADDPLSLDLAGEVWQRLRSGAAKLLIDSSSEGYAFAPERFARIDAALHAVGLGPSDCIYVTQHRGFRADYLAHRRALGLDGAGMDVLVHDRYIQYLFAAALKPGPARFREQLKAYASAEAVRERRFISLNNKFRPVRMLFLLRLLQDGLWSSGYISLGKLYEFGGRAVSKPKLMQQLTVIEQLRPLAEQLTPLFEQLESYSPQYVGLEGRAPTRAADDLMIVPKMFEEYGQSWFSIVLETDFSDRLHRITEKPFKPLLCFHPMILLGSCGSLGLIKQYGFSTFSGLFDESYDQEADPLARFEMVYEQVDRLCRMDEAELAQRCDSVQEAWSSMPAGA